MDLGKAVHQKPGRPGPGKKEGGEAAGLVVGGEAALAVAGDADSGRALLARALERDNMQRACRRVRSNGGRAGVDGRTVAQTQEFLSEHWPRIREELLSGRYRPSPVRRHPGYHASTLTARTP